MKFNRNIIIGDRTISDTAPVFIIAEAGVNHGGDIEIAKQLIDIAAESGADAVKFQAFRTENLILKSVEKAPYQQQTTDAKEGQFEMLKKLELTKQHYQALKDYCDQKDIIFMITPFDEESLKELEEIGVNAYKVASTDTTNIPFLRKLAMTKKPLILSTGMCYMDEVKQVVSEIFTYNKDLILLQCTANYPIEDNEANLAVVKTYIDTFDCIVGYSDHSVGIGAAPLSIPMGAKVVEKHFTINKEDSGPDHLASLDPEELKSFVKYVRQIEQYMGQGIKEPTASEAKTRKSLQKCLVAKEKINQGKTFTDENLVAKRTGGVGISPLHYPDLLGKAATKDYEPNDIIDEQA